MTKCVIETFEKLRHELAAIPSKQATLLLSVDGLSGAGKSVFSRALAHSKKSITVVKMDDFFFPFSLKPTGDPILAPIGGDLDWQRLRRQVLEPISWDLPGRYQRYNRFEDRLAEWHTVPVGDIVVIEGIYSMRKELADAYDFKVWVECPRNVRLARGMTRGIAAYRAKESLLDPEKLRELWEKDWRINENRYIDDQNPSQRADLLVDGSGSSNYDYTLQFVRLIR